MIKEGIYTSRIRDMAAVDRPRERIAEKGAESLSTAELIGVLLRVGVSGENSVQMGQRVLNELGGVLGLQRASFHEVCSLHGLGPAKAAQLKAAIELGRRVAQASPQERRSIQSPADAADLIAYEMQGFSQEHLWVLLLDTRNQVIHIEKLYVGSLNSSMVRVGELFRAAVHKNAASIIIAHNHPSGDPAPSPEDVALTRSAIQAGALLDIAVLDHLVIGQGRYVSLKERGLACSSG